MLSRNLPLIFLSASNVLKIVMSSCFAVKRLFLCSSVSAALFTNSCSNVSPILCNFSDDLRIRSMSRFNSRFFVCDVSKSNRSCSNALLWSRIVDRASVTSLYSSSLSDFAIRNSSALVSINTFIFFFRSSFRLRSSAKDCSADLTLSTHFFFSFSKLDSSFSRAAVTVINFSLVDDNSVFRESFSDSNLPAALLLTASFFFASFNLLDNTISRRSDSSFDSLILSNSDSTFVLSVTSDTIVAFIFSSSSSISENLEILASYSASLDSN
mmetsp:Transcript_3253/g.4416  ORF Transcript_3253/g.4416 Transcript_3253/m.4416 type:complete len:269 (+) Transcript_3253:766-1572(+)